MPAYAALETRYLAGDTDYTVRYTTPTNMERPTSASPHRLVILALSSSPTRLLAAALDARAQGQDVLILNVRLLEHLCKQQRPLEVITLLVNCSASMQLHAADQLSAVYTCPKLANVMDHQPCAATPYLAWALSTAAHKAETKSKPAQQHHGWERTL